MTLAEQARNIVFVSDNPRQALEAPRHFKIALPADPAYSEWRADSYLKDLRDQHRPALYTWADCRETPAAEAARLAAVYGLNGWIGEAESRSELEHALNAGAGIVVGKPRKENWGDLFDQAKHLVEQGLLAVIAECYTNAGDTWPNLYDSQGLPVASICIGLYDGSSENPQRGRYITVAEYQANTLPGVWQGICVYVSGLHPGELGWLPGPVAPPGPPAPAVPSAFEVRQQIAKTAREWEKRSGLSRTARISVARRIVDAKSTDQRWNSVSRRIAALLDEAGIV